MKSFIAVVFMVTLSLSKFTEALPTKQQVSDPQVLNFALTLEHLESAFYKQALARFSQADFLAAGHPDWTRGRYQQISDHEEIHVKFLSTALTTAGAQAVSPCEYNFPITDIHSFVDLSTILEGVGAAAYTGGAQLIASKNYLTVAGSILAVEARHAAWIDSAVKQSSAWDTAFQSDLTPSQVYGLAVPFVKSCPTSNTAALPSLTAYPILTVTDAHPGSTATLGFSASKATSQLFAAFISGVGAPTFVVVPSNLIGFVFCVITNDGGMADDSTTVAGPTILNFAFDSRGRVV
ncbi:ferritin-like domain-containing protein [Mycena crocata]|nr:ferritin-like domain-containing protein [Mycena crocata]